MSTKHAHIFLLWYNDLCEQYSHQCHIFYLFVYHLFPLVSNVYLHARITLFIFLKNNETLRGTTRVVFVGCIAHLIKLVKTFCFFLKVITTIFYSLSRYFPAPRASLYNIFPLFGIKMSLAATFSRLVFGNTKLKLVSKIWD